jgi:uncharacterized damage-inducible protein DinB
MKISRSILLFLLCAVCSPLLVSAQNQSVSDIIDHQVKGVEGEFVSAAEAMPEDKYSFAPANGEFKGVRTFAQQIKHVAAVNYDFGAIILGEKPPVDTNEEKGPDSLQSKADIVNYLKNSFLYLHKAVASINESNMITPMKNPWGQKNPVTRLQIAMIAAAHPWDHYGQMVVYLRMNGVVPPASR